MKNIFDTRKLRPNEVIVHNGYGGTIPVNSFARITGYDKTNQHFDIGRPDADFMSEAEIVVVPEEITIGELGIGIIGGIGVVEETSGETISAGDVVGTDTGEFTAILGAGGFKVLHDDSGALVLKRTGGGGVVIHKAFCRDDAGAGSTITCYLDEDGTGEEITVNCSIAQGGSALNAASSRLKDGDLLFVFLFDEDWYALGTPWQPTEDCDCYEAP